MILSTDRLRIRPLHLSDADFVLSLLNDPDWLRYIGNRGVKDRQDAIAYIKQGPMQSQRHSGFSLQLVERKDSGQAIGLCGLLQREFLQLPDIGFAFLPGGRGQGFAFEAAQATCRYAADKLGIKRLCAMVSPDNQASIALLKKLGMCYLGTIQTDKAGQLTAIYATNAAQLE